MSLVCRPQPAGRVAEGHPGGAVGGAGGVPLLPEAIRSVLVPCLPSLKCGGLLRR